MRFSVKQARQYAGLTQIDIANRLGISRDSYRKIEITPDKTPIVLAKKFSEIVGISIDQIFFSQDSTLSRSSSLEHGKEPNHERNSDFQK